MSGSKSNPLNLLPHRKTQSQLPLLSLTQLQKNYLASKQKKKNQQHFSLSTLPNLNSNHEILIKSPFYDRTNCTNKKATCKCQFHKRQKLLAQKLFPFQKKHKILQQFHLDRLKSFQSSSPLLKKEYSKNKMNTSVNETDQFIRKNEELKRLIDQNKEQYMQYLKRIKQKNSSEVDCHNMQFQQFLKQHNHWILHQVKHKKTPHKLYRISQNLDQNNDNSIINNLSYEKNNLSYDKTFNQTSQNPRHYLRFKTLPSNFDNQDSDQDQDEDQINLDKKSRKKNLKFNLEQTKLLRKNKKKFTQIVNSSRDSFLSNKKKSSYKFLKNIDTLKSEDRIKLQQFYQKAFQSIGLNYSDFKSKSIQNPHFFGTLCKNLINPDQKVVQQAKNVLKRISRLPLNIYSTVLKQIKLQLQDKAPNDRQNKNQETKKSVTLAFETIQKNIQELVKNKEEFKGKQKISILGKIRNRYVGRGSVNSMRFSEIKKKFRSPSSIDNNNSLAFNQLKDVKKSRFASEAQAQIPESQQSGNQNNNLLQNLTNQEQGQQQKDQQKEQDNMFVQKQKQREVKKGLKMKKLKKNKNIIKMIDEEIQEQNNIKPILPKKSNPKFDDQYEKERLASRKKLRDEEYRQHLQFMQKIKERTNQRQSSTITEYQIKRNSVKAHLMKHKMFIKKMELYLTQNSDLKDMVINLEDNLFTKKRKVRILNQMINQLLIAEPNSKFYQDLKKYIQIFQKSCDLAVKQKKDKQYKKLAKKKISQEELYQEDFRSKQNPDSPFDLQKFINSINLDNQLKFYKVDFIQMEQEDIDAIVKQFLSRPNQQVKLAPIKEKLVRFEVEKIVPELRKVLDQKLIQVGLDNITEKILMEKFQEVQKQQLLIDCNKIQIESKELKKLKERFKKNMQKYEKCFNLNRSLI